MKVLEVTGEPILHGGQEKFIANLIEKMDDPAITMDVLTFYNCENNAFRELVQGKGGKVFELKHEFQPGSSRRFILHDLQEFLEKERYDVVHTHSGSISVLAYSALAAKKAGVRKRLVHSHCASEYSLKHKLVQMVFGGIIKRNATDFLACSMVAGRDKFPQSIVDNRMTIISNGIDLKRFESNPETRAAMREKLGFDDSTFVIGSVGRFSYQKNTEYALEVFAAAKEELKDCKLLLVGDGELKEDLLKKVKELRIQDEVIFTGNVDNAQDYYQAMDLFVLPSRFEGLPFVALEAQAAGIPSIISDGVTKEAVICNDVVQLPLEPKDAWITAIVEIGKAPREVHNNTKTLSEAGFDINNTVKQVKAIYLR